MIAAHLDNLIFLLLVAVAVLFQWLAKTAGKTGKNQTKRTSPTPIPRTPSPTPRAATDSDEARIRKLLEALGQPPSSKPPPPIAPRADVPHRPLTPVRPPTVYPSSPWQWIPEQQRKREAIPKKSASPQTTTSEEKIVPRRITNAPVFEVHKGPSPIAPSPPITLAGVTQTIVKTDELRTDIATLLASTSGLRNAIIFREMLGPPRGVRTTDDVLQLYPLPWLPRGS
jgi:hypothetical protein